MLQNSCPIIYANFIDKTWKEEEVKRQVAFVSFDNRLANPIITDLFHQPTNCCLFSLSTERLSNNELITVYNWPISFANNLKELIENEKEKETFLVLLVELKDIEKSLSQLQSALTLFSPFSNLHLIIYFEKNESDNMNEVFNQIVRLIAFRYGATVHVGSQTTFSTFLRSLLLTGGKEGNENSHDSFSILRNWDSLEKIRMSTQNTTFSVDQIAGQEEDGDFFIQIQILIAGKRIERGENEFLIELDELINNEITIDPTNKFTSSPSTTKSTLKPDSDQGLLKAKQKEAISNFFQSLLQKTKQNKK